MSSVTFVEEDNKKEVSIDIEYLWAEALVIEARWKAEVARWVRELGMWETFS